ncbi:MAG: competence/damage-inducible protein A [Candidatus Omnitrophota bacterium]|nr:MAG: competence/damage-inducible protein A [Candidatus Omnitrophota bacterium]
MKAEIINIGTEILLGHIVNTNSAYLSRKLAEVGIDIYYHTTVGDNLLRLYAAIQRALGRSDIVITTGGLGPTVDDITLKTIARVLDKKLIYKDQIWQRIEDHFKKRHIKTPKNNLRQAYIPQGSRWLKNGVGTAPGIIAKKNKKILIALPGPPLELIPMVERDMVTDLKKFTHKKSKVIKSKVLKTTGLAESQVHPKIKKFLHMSGNTTAGIYAHPAQIDIKITTKAKNEKETKKNISAVEKQIRKRLGDLIFGCDDETLEAVVAGLLIKNNKTIAIAESCTGGLLSNRLTDIPGSSNYLMHSIIAYSNKSKTQLLGVPEEIIKKYGAVSRQTAKLMAKNVKELANVDIGLSITGIAGPSGETKQKPVGLVYIAVVTKNKIICKEFHFSGERKLIKFRSSQAALDMLRRHLLHG